MFGGLYFLFSYIRSVYETKIWLIIWDETPSLLGKRWNYNRIENWFRIRRRISFQSLVYMYNVYRRPKRFLFLPKNVHILAQIHIFWLHVIFLKFLWIHLIFLDQLYHRYKYMRKPENCHNWLALNPTMWLNCSLMIQLDIYIKLIHVDVDPFVRMPLVQHSSALVFARKVQND